MAEQQYINPGEDFTDETENEGQHIVPGQAFVDSPSVSATVAVFPVVFVVT